jgi:hypothetical protein
MADRCLVAFIGEEVIARGPLAEVVVLVKERIDAGEDRRVALFDEETGRIIDVDYSGSRTEVLSRLPSPTGAPGESPRRGPGRPRLGVVSREISLLPRHWEWLSEQRGGASATLRRLVDEARKNEGREAIQRRAIDAAHRFLWDIAGNQPDFEEVTRALFAKDFSRCRRLTGGWPSGIREQLDRYLERAG